jgi:hypothetical protein
MFEFHLELKVNSTNLQEQNPKTWFASKGFELETFN